MRNINSVYFRWLCSLVSGHKVTYLRLSDLLHSIPFYWSIPNDDNRVEDGRELRNEFLEYMDFRNINNKTRREFMANDVSVFEVLVALTRRMEYATSAPPESLSKFYTELLVNLGFEELADNYFKLDSKFPAETEARVKKTVNTMMNRKYDFNGVGSLFPIKRTPPRDMRITEIWYQMMYYIQENYRF